MFGKRYYYYEVFGGINKTVLRKATDEQQVYIFTGTIWEKIDKSEWSKLKMAYISDKGAKELIAEAKKVFKATGKLDVATC